MPIAVGFVLFLGVCGVAYMLRSNAAAKQLRATAMEQVAGLIQGKAWSETLATGSLEGFKIEVEYTTRGSGSSSETWTEMRASVGSIAMELALREEDPVTRLMVKATDAVDVQIGDPAFDKAFVIDGAPAHAVTHVLADTVLRETLLSLAPLELSQTDGKLLLAKRGWLLSEKLLPGTRAVARLAKRMHEAVRLLPTAGGSFEHPSKLAPYRSEAMVAPDGKAELERLQAARARFQRLKMQLSYGMLAIIVAVVTAFTFGSKAC